MSDKKVQLRDPRSTKTIELPSFKDSQIEIYPYLMMGDITGVKVTEENMDELMKVLPRFIKSWNFVDEKEQPLPINKDSLNLLPIDDITFLFTNITEFAKEQKKSSST